MSFLKDRYVPLTLYLAVMAILPALSLSAQHGQAVQVSLPADSSVTHPFPQHTTYHDGIILPAHIPRTQMDDSVRSFYDAWKNRYIRPGCGPGQYYVWFDESEGHKQCVSEGQGYGMMIVALMAGYDSSARKVFDGLFHYFRSHPSKTDPYLMAWAQKKDCRDIERSSATDGDMDIAYSLLMANAQWGSQGEIDYLGEALHMISSILKGEINHRTLSILLSNDVEHDSEDYFDMRSSDFMPAHFRAFAAFSGDSSWNKVMDNNYRLFGFLQDKFSPEAGLLPDFIDHINIYPVTRGFPAHAHYLESRYDGAYNYNACRVPWRVGTDYILNGDPRAAEIVKKINSWIRSTTQGNPDNISAGYSLAGEDLKNRYYEAMCFIAPFAVAAMISPDNQVWLNRLWDYIVHFSLKDFGYYDNSIKMLGLIILSGNFWEPAPR